MALPEKPLIDWSPRYAHTPRREIDGMDRNRVHLRGVRGIVDPFENATRRVIPRCLAGPAGTFDHD
jgi:hypothetical protein